MKTTRLRVTLRDVAPPVWRLVDVPTASTLPELHWLLQAAMGWHNTHLHQFETPSRRWGSPDDEGLELHDDETDVKVAALGRGFLYRYDFGDDWEHDVEILGHGGDRVAVVDGAGACPREDSGGPHTQADVQGPRPFDLALADLLVQQTAGAVPEAVRLLLSLMADGVRLTPGGRLPRAIVRAVQDERPSWHPLRTPASTEEDLKPLPVLDVMLRDVGLLRLRHGVLAPTKAAADDLEVMRRIRGWREEDSFGGVVTVLAVAHLETGGPQTQEALARAVFADLGPFWSTASGERVQPRHVREQLSRMSVELDALDLADTDARTWAAGPSARTLLPRATFACAYFD